MIAADGLGVRFAMDRQRRPVTPLLERLRRAGSEAWGLRDVTLAIAAGEGVALIGASGSGKTTLLRAIAGVLPADEGTVTVAAPVAPLLAVDAGLMSVLTGRENAELLGVLHGRTVAAARAAADGARDRAGLGADFERPVAGWSQGMRARLGLAVADGPGVLVLDEVHEALDHAHRDVLEARAADVRRAGGAVVAAGHDHEMLARLCDRAVWLEGGRVVRDGPFAAVRDDYLSPRT